jgi:hypothetical protein
MFGASYILRWRPTGDAIQAGLHAQHGRRLGRMNVERLIFFFALEGRLREFSGLNTRSAEPDRMNVERLIFFFCVGDSTAWDSGWAERA